MLEWSVFKKNIAFTEIFYFWKKEKNQVTFNTVEFTNTWFREWLLWHCSFVLALLEAMENGKARLGSFGKRKLKGKITARRHGEKKKLPQSEMWKGPRRRSKTPLAEYRSFALTKSLFLIKLSESVKKWTFFKFLIKLSRLILLKNNNYVF